MSSLASELGIESHQLSKSFELKTNEDQLRQRVQHLILDFRMDIITQHMKDLQRQIKEAGKDKGQLEKLLMAYKDAQELRNLLARQLGSNVIV